VNCLNPEVKLFESGGNYHLEDLFSDLPKFPNNFKVIITMESEFLNDDFQGIGGCCRRQWHMYGLVARIAA
jgi:hypothetical protein